MNRENDNREISSKEQRDTILRLATQEGRIFKAGASGKYQKNLITRIGFILLGLPFLVFFPITYTILKKITLADGLGQVLISVLLAVVFFGLGSIGILMIMQAIKK